MIILDFGSGETCQNSKELIDRMLGELYEVDTRKHKVIIKWQLFRSIPGLKQLSFEIFNYACMRARRYNYETTASVFDDISLDFLRCYRVPFIKIACRYNLYEYPAKNPDREFIVSVDVSEDADKMSQLDNVNLMYCIPNYPADPNVYSSYFGPALHYGISDHTTDFELFYKYEPLIYETHYRLSDSTGADSGPWAKTPEMLKGIL